MRISLYRSLPPSLQRLSRRFYAMLPKKWRLGKTYWETRKLLASAEQWSAEQIKEWQVRKIRSMVNYAYENVSGYHQLYNSAGVKPEMVRTLEELTLLPTVTKELLRDNLRDFTARTFPQWRLLYRTTGGSTGIPFGFYLLQKDIERELAFMHTSWQRTGWKPGERSAVLRGAFIGSESNLHEFDPVWNELKLSTYYLTEKSYGIYLALLKKYTPGYLQAYPSAATIFADMILAQGDAGKIPFKTIFLGSENIYPGQMEKIAAAFPGAKLFAWYGHAEQILFAPMCFGSDRLHLEPLYGYAETELEKGELIGTSFWNLATPFIRYRTMDIAVRGPFGCDACGRQVQLLEKVEGRLQELLVTGTGRYISMTQINMHSGVFDHVRQFQFHQKEPGAVTFNVVKKPTFTEKDSKEIRTELEKKLGMDMRLDIRFVDSIPLTKNGKMRFLIQELPLRYGEHGNP